MAILEALERRDGERAASLIAAPHRPHRGRPRPARQARPGAAPSARSLSCLLAPFQPVPDIGRERAFDMQSRRRLSGPVEQAGNAGEHDRCRRAASIEVGRTSLPRPAPTARHRRSPAPHRHRRPASPPSRRASPARLQAAQPDTISARSRAMRTTCGLASDHAPQAGLRRARRQRLDRAGDPAADQDLAEAEHWLARANRRGGFRRSAQSGEAVQNLLRSLSGSTIEAGSRRRRRRRAG